MWSKLLFEVALESKKIEIIAGAACNLPDNYQSGPHPYNWAGLAVLAYPKWLAEFLFLQIFHVFFI